MSRAPETRSRRNALGAIAAGLGGFWTLALGGLTAAFVTTPLRRSETVQEIPMGALSNFGATFTPVRVHIRVREGWKKRTDSRLLYIRVSKSDGNPVVLSGQCTHLGCTVNWDEESAEFLCPCHEGRYSADGEVTAGPPPRALDSVDVVVRDGSVFARMG